MSTQCLWQLLLRRALSRAVPRALQCHMNAGSSDRCLGRSVDQYIHFDLWSDLFSCSAQNRIEIIRHLKCHDSTHRLCFGIITTLCRSELSTIHSGCHYSSDPVQVQSLIGLIVIIIYANIVLYTTLRSHLTAKPSLVCLRK